MALDLLVLTQQLAASGEPFALATVVRCDRPTSAKPGAKAVVRKDGTISGWVGGSCAEPVVVKEALRALADGRPRLIALVGEGGAGPGKREGVLEYPMTCHSGGTLEIFVEPMLPRSRMVLIGKGPVVETLAKLGEAMEFTVDRIGSEDSVERLSQLRATRQTFIVVVTHGTFDEDAVERALRTGARYVSLVASRKRAQAVLDVLRDRGVAADLLARLKAPAGLDIGAVNPNEIAASILAEIVQVSRTEAHADTPGVEESIAAAEAAVRDPVCGMDVEIASATYRSDVQGRTFYFCCARCKRVFDKDPARYMEGIAG
ncbi:MAG TPA: XdhC family protein [bacterium]|nr:XdhC family protein [bacterium]